MMYFNSTRRLTDNDGHFGPITFGKSGRNALRLVWCSGGGDDEGDGKAWNHLTAYAFGWCARIPMPNLIQPLRIHHEANWDAATVARLGRDWYEEVFPREYGFSLSDGFLQVFLGTQTHDSRTTQSWAKHLPWTQWRHVRFSLYDLDGNHFWTAPNDRDYEAQREAEDSTPKATFVFNDYDGERIQVATHIQEREWRFGEGWFKWLSLFRRPKIRRSLDLRFSSEVGPEKGSWKGGVMGTSLSMLPGDTPESAFRRYCEEEHRSKSRKYKITYVGRVA